MTPHKYLGGIKMKKIVALILSVLLVLSLSACGSKDTTEPSNTTPGTSTTTPADKPTEEAGQYKDGVYPLDGEKGEYGYNAVEVTVEGGKISKVELKRMNPDGTEVNYDEWTGVEANGTTKPNLKQFREDMASQIIEKQSTEGIDTISGATDSTKSWLELVNKALESAK